MDSSKKFVVRELGHGPAGYWSVVIGVLGACPDAADVASRFGHLSGEPLPDFKARVARLRRGMRVVIERPKRDHVLGCGDIVIERAPEVGR